VPEGVEVAFDGVLEAIESAITLTGTLTVPWAGECRRCLDEVTGVEDIEVREVFETRPTPGETYPIQGDDVDLEPVIRDAVLLELPLAPLCGPDCRGPAPEAFPALPADAAIEGDGDAPDEPARDPRWAALDVLRSGDE
jgi:uncharacterized protein